MNKEISNKNKSNANVKLGICQWSFPVDTSSMCKFAAEIGLQGIELNFGEDWKNHPLKDKEVQSLYLSQAEQYGIEFPTIGLNALCDIGMTKKENFAIVQEIFKQAIDIAISMNISILQVPSFGNGIIDTEDEFKQTIESLNYGCRIAEKHNLIIGTENALSWQQNLRIIEEVEHDNIKIYFDTQNPYAMNGYCVAELADKLSPYICEIHAKDGANGGMGNTLIGEGEAGFNETMERFKLSNYKGWVFFETKYNRLGYVIKDVETMKKHML